MKRYSYCPVCGSPYRLVGSSTAASLKLLLCSSCGFEFWQNSKPAVGALIIRIVDRQPQVLLTRRGVEPYKGMWDCPGGYLENGELPEAGLARELVEELGVHIVRPRLFSLGIDEYPRDDVAEEARFVLSLYYRCEISADAHLAAADDVAEAAWFPLDQPPAKMAFASNRRALDELRAAWEAESSRGPLSG
ncbi:MAG: NUDIX domain-containing protein [Spirochaetia bacterium]